ncbi:uncharacterized mitochondrial protein AtMg00810-like [Carya illinoinensis]|uniref:uncharacterized mitochondrial protein AtMg00810-like n=1 Tax=Carya illinoinensis TaxID=32201 RepID=UPI001C725A74|nr:uncharacterized mitochondrial protein AtMg00810-like [Carya illinoinensis]
MSAELSALEANSTWTLEPLPHCKKPIGYKWADHSLFTLVTSTSITIVLVYVDDILVARNNISHIQLFKDILSSHFKTKDLGPLKYFLGLEVVRSPKGIFLNQRKYALNILSDSGQLGACSAPFPMEQNLKLTNYDRTLLSDPCIYRRLVGHLIYLTITLLDIIFALNILNQFMHASQAPHMQAATCVLRYIKSNPGQGIFFSSSNGLHITAYTDSDWASCPITRRSTTGYFIQLGSSPISWRTKKQKTVAHSSAEAEYCARVVTTCELTWLKQLLTDLGISHPSLSAYIVTINRLYTSLIILCFMNVPNILRLIVTSFVTKSNLVSSPPFILPFMSKFPTSSPKP